MTLNRDSIINLFAGGCGGTMGAIVTCPLEVVKTRLQSSSFNLMAALPPPAARCKATTTCSTLPNCGSVRKVSTSALTRCQIMQLSHNFPGPPPSGSQRSLSLLHCFKYIIEVEGPWALWKGLGPNLVGVAPSRAIYFCSYSQMKKLLEAAPNIPDGPVVHVLSAASAGFTACTITNPIWFIKTRLQLDHSKHGRKINTIQCIRNVYNTKGISGFYKGLTASYYGVSETVIHFVIYEAIKKKIQTSRPVLVDDSSKSTRDFLEFMIAAAISKTCASSICYPHEVARTRLREEGRKYRGFWQTLGTVLKEEGWAGLYRGLATQLLRQIPNTAIMMGTYEGVVYILTKYHGDNEFYEDYCDTEELSD